MKVPMEISIALGAICVFLCVAVLTDILSNPLERTGAYRKARRRMWTLPGLLYAFYYTGRYNMSVINNAAVRANLKTTKSGFGLCLTAGHVSYAVSMLYDGRFADRYGGVAGICVGALGSASVNAISAFLFAYKEHTLLLLGILNVVNNAFQPFGSLCVVKINSAWWAVRERGVFSGIMGVMIGCGYFLALVMGGFIINTTEFYVVFAKPAVSLVVGAICVWFFVKNSPQEAGVASSDDMEQLEHVVSSPRRGSSLPSSSSSGGDGGGTTRRKPMSVRQLFQNPAMRILAVAMFCIGWCREGFLAWFTSWLEEAVGVPVGSMLYTIAATGITIGGMIGSLGGGFVSDRFFGSRRGPVCGILFVLQGFVLSALAIFGAPTATIAVVVVSLFAMSLFGVLTLIIGSASADFAGKRDTGAASGMLNCFQYTASGVSSFVTGWLVENFGWDAWALALLPAPIVGAVCMWRLNILQRRARPAAITSSQQHSSAEDNLSPTKRPGRAAVHVDATLPSDLATLSLDEFSTPGQDEEDRHEKDR